MHLCKCVGIEDESLLKTRTFSFCRFAKRAEGLVRLDERREVLLLESGEDENPDAFITPDVSVKSYRIATRMFINRLQVQLMPIKKNLCRPLPPFLPNS